MTMQKRVSTAEFARSIGITTESLRTHVYRKGSYYGIRPIKGPNRRLLWPADGVERLIEERDPS